MIDDCLCVCVLLYDGVVDWFVGFFVLDDGGFVLVCDFDGGDVVLGEVGVFEGEVDDFLDVVLDFGCVVFYLVGFGKDLFVFFLFGCDDVVFFVEDDCVV